MGDNADNWELSILMQSLCNRPRM